MCKSYLLGQLNANQLDNEFGLCLSQSLWKKGLMLLISDLVQMRTKKDLNCLNMSFFFLSFCGFQKMLLTPSFRRALLQCICSFSVLLI